ncbi:hypothetical protein [Moraxella lacunata]|uniref:hypothetical protein n=1 Tax=Moraxella lacunata TaxID=477 RepID=UPI003EDEABEF
MKVRHVLSYYHSFKILTNPPFYMKCPNCAKLSHSIHHKQRPPPPSIIKRPTQGMEHSTVSQPPLIHAHHKHHLIMDIQPPQISTVPCGNA